jgi:hypothetical protein
MKTRLWKIIFAVLLSLPLCANATFNSNSKVLDGIEYYVQTDKFTYELGENVEMLYRITNLSDQNVTFTLPGSPVWNFWIEEDGQQTYQAVKGWWTMITQFTLAPGESKEFPEPNPPFVWDMRDDDGDMVGVDNYDVIGGLLSMPEYHYYDYTKVSVPIEIIPEPTTLTFLTIVLSVIRGFSRRKT